MFGFWKKRVVFLEERLREEIALRKRIEASGIPSAPDIACAVCKYSELHELETGEYHRVCIVDSKCPNFSLARIEEHT